MTGSYAEDGYLVRRGLVPADLIAELNEHFAGIAEGSVELAHNMQVVRNIEVAKGLVEPRTKAHGISKVNFFMSDPVFSRYASHPAVLYCLAPSVPPQPTRGVIS